MSARHDGIVSDTCAYLSRVCVCTYLASQMLEILRGVDATQLTVRFTVRAQTSHDVLGNLKQDTYRAVRPLCVLTNVRNGQTKLNLQITLQI